jgi:hypothetical protein
MKKATNAVVRINLIMFVFLLSMALVPIKALSAELELHYVEGASKTKNISINEKISIMPVEVQKLLSTWYIRLVPRHTINVLLSKKPLPLKIG